MVAMHLLLLGLTVGSALDLALILCTPWLILKTDQKQISRIVNNIHTRKITILALDRLRPIDPTEEKIRTRIEGLMLN
jgi:hypothetical protein